MTMRSNSDSNKTGNSTTSTLDSVPEISDRSSWHQTASLLDGTPIGRLGAYWYILDQDGYAISDGYHEISCDEHGNYKGKRSARIEEVVIYNNQD